MRSDLRTGAVIRAVLLALLSFSVLSCNLFQTREPENPVSENQTLPIAYTKEILYANIKLSIEQRNLQEYGNLFSDTATHPHRFVFIPSQSSGARYASVFSSWDRTMETEWFRKATSAVSSTSSIQFQVTSAPQIVPFQGDSAIITFDYLLFIPHNRSDVKVQQFVGRCELAVAPDRNPPIWRIYRWIDFETKKDSSWSELKGQFAK